MNLRILGILTAILISGNFLPGQTDSLVLEAVEISAPRVEFWSTGLKTSQPDSMSLREFAMQGLGELMKYNSGVFIKDYGPGRIASPSFRGTGAGHTAVLWHGFNLQNSMHGTADFSLVSAGLHDYIRIQPGGTSAVFGSGAMGGVIHLGKRTEFQEKVLISAGAEAGSFGRVGGKANIQIGSANYSGSANFIHQNSANTFRYLSRDLLQTYTGGAFQQTGMSVDQAFRITPRQKIHAHLWYLDRGSQLPGKAFQADQGIRAALVWERTGNRNYSEFRSGYFRDRILFEDTLSSISSLSTSQTFTQEAETRIILSDRHILQIGGNLSYQEATSDGYRGDTFHEIRGAAFGAWKYHLNSRWESALSIRQGLRVNQRAPVIPAWGIIRKGKNLSFRTHVSRNFRFPTFNDLYWSPGGNPELRPESGWSAESGFNWSEKGSYGLISSDITFFHSRIKDWILWVPGTNFWYSENILKVHSKGVEAEFEYRKYLGRWNLSANLAGQWTRSTRQNRTGALDGGLNRQLIYVPVYTSQGNIRIYREGFSVTYRHSFTGRRYTATDNSAYLPAYFLGKIHVSKTFYLSDYQFDAYASADNLWNTSYQIVAGQPMPLRAFSLGFHVYWQKPD